MSLARLQIFEPEPAVPETPKEQVVLDLTELRNRAGKFGFDALVRADLAVISWKLMKHEELTSAELKFLVTQPALPHLGKLASVLRESDQPRYDHLTRPVLLLPLAGWLEEGGMQYALKLAADRLAKLQKDLACKQKLLLVLDRWNGQFPISNLFKLIGELSLKLTAARILGPSSLEVRHLQSVFAEQHLPAEPEDVLRALRRSGISSLEGGSDFEIHEAAIRCGFIVTVSQMISPLHQEPRQLALIAADAPQSAFTEETAHSFISNILFVRSRLAPTGKLYAWFPWGPKAHPLELLRAAVLARLLLPASVQVRAPASRLGPELAEIALLFGAEDLGFAAVDSETAAALDIFRISDLSSLTAENAEFRRVVGM